MRHFEEAEDTDTADDHGRAVVSDDGDMWDLENLASLRISTSALTKHDKLGDLAEDLLDMFFQLEDNAASFVPLRESEKLETAVQHALGDEETCPNDDDEIEPAPSSYPTGSVWGFVCAAEELSGELDFLVF